LSAHVVFAGSTDRPTDRPTDPAWAAAAGWIRSARPEHRFRRAPRGPRYRTVRSTRGTCRELARATSAPFDSLVAPPATARHDERSPTCFACGPVRICQTATADSHRRPVCIRVIPHVANTRVGIQPSSNARRRCMHCIAQRGTASCQRSSRCRGRCANQPGQYGRPCSHSPSLAAALRGAAFGGGGIQSCSRLDIAACTVPALLEPPRSRPGFGGPADSARAIRPPLSTFPLG